jgi:hypothetical protein
MARGVLNKAKRQKEDEFYTQLSDIEREIKHYKKHFKGKIVFCNCDDPETSNFYYYFVSNFEELGLKKLITTHFEIDKASYMLEYEGGANVQGEKETVVKRAIKLGRKKPLKQNYEQGEQGSLFEDEPVRSYSGDFRSPECIELLKQSDIVVTNPPFSLFREYVSQLIQYKKKFIIIGSKGAISYKELFKLLKENKIWSGFGFANGNAFFSVSNPRDFASGVYDEKTGLVKFRNVGWFTNLDHKKRHESLILFKNYNPDDYPKYDNYDAIEVSTCKEIPMDYNGAMGVPVTFLDVYNPDQFLILGITDRDNNSGLKTKEYTKNDVKNPSDLNRRAVIKIGSNYRSTFARLLIKRKTK